LADAQQILNRLSGIGKVRVDATGAASYLSRPAED